MTFKLRSVISGFKVQRDVTSTLERLFYYSDYNTPLIESVVADSKDIIDHYRTVIMYYVMLQTEANTFSKINSCIQPFSCTLSFLFGTIEM